MSKERGNQTEVVNESELLLRIWEEQIIAARHYIIGARQRRPDAARLQIQGVHFMLLTLREQLLGLRQFNARETVENQYTRFVEQVEANWTGAL